MVKFEVNSAYEIVHMQNKLEIVSIFMILDAITGIHDRFWQCQEIPKQIWGTYQMQSL